MDRWPINRKWITGRAVADKARQHIHDLHGPEGDGFPEGRELGRQQGQRTVLSVPLLREGEAIGAISLRRIEVHPFSDKQVALLESFADQAYVGEAFTMLTMEPGPGFFHAPLGDNLDRLTRCTLSRKKSQRGWTYDIAGRVALCVN